MRQVSEGGKGRDVAYLIIRKVKMFQAGEIDKGRDVAYLIRTKFERPQIHAILNSRKFGDATFIRFQLDNLSQFLKSETPA